MLQGGDSSATEKKKSVTSSTRSSLVGPTFVGPGFMGPVVVGCRVDLEKARPTVASWPSSNAAQKAHRLERHVTRSLVPCALLLPPRQTSQRSHGRRWLDSWGGAMPSSTSSKPSCAYAGTVHHGTGHGAPNRIVLRAAGRTGKKSRKPASSVVHGAAESQYSSTRQLRHSGIMPGA